MWLRATCFGYLCAGAVRGQLGARHVLVVGDPHPGPKYLLLGDPDVVRDLICHGADRATSDPA